MIDPMMLALVEVHTEVHDMQSKLTEMAKDSKLLNMGSQQACEEGPAQLVDSSSLASSPVTAQQLAEALERLTPQLTKAIAAQVALPKLPKAASKKDLTKAKAASPPKVLRRCALLRARSVPNMLRAERG